MFGVRKGSADTDGFSRLSGEGCERRRVKP